jgi:hypothetical protein
VQFNEPWCEAGSDPQAAAVTESAA